MRSLVRALSLPFVVLVVATAGAGQEPQPVPARDGRRLVYELPIDTLQRALRHQPDQDLEQVLARAVRTVASRLGNQVVVQRTGAGFTVDVPPDLVPQLPSLRRRIEAGGHLELRIVADSDFVAGPVRFDLPAEKARLQAWLANPEHRRMLLQDPRTIARFNTDTRSGPLSSGNFAWYPHRLRPNPNDDERWEVPWSQVRSLEQAMAIVKVYDDAQWNGGLVPDAVRKGPARERFLIELVALNLNEVHFTGDDLDPATVGVAAGPAGDIAVNYCLQAAKALEYADWSQKYIGKRSAIVLDGFVLSAPMFASKLPGRGQINGVFTRQEADDLALALKSGPLVVPPQLVVEEPLPASQFAPAGK